jgi:hypothetical protein
MARYMLGALAAIVLVGATAFYVLARLNDGNAETLPAPPVTVVFLDRGPIQQRFEFEVDRPTDIVFDNRTDYARAITWDGLEAEQLTNIKQPPPGGPATPRIYIEAPPHKGVSGTVRFTKRGTYTMHIVVPNMGSSFEMVAEVK